jgi:hypothetical protein
MSAPSGSCVLESMESRGWIPGFTKIDHRYAAVFPSNGDSAEKALRTVISHGFW